MRRGAGALALPALLAACAPALREPAPLAPAAPGSRSAAALLADADAAWARRADPALARAAQDLYLEAAAADPGGVDGLLGAMRAISWRLEGEKDASARGALAARAVELGQWCQRRAPERAACDYRLAIALGEQARERHATAHDALPRMVSLLRRAIAADPRQDQAGPHRVLALLLLRAPGWPAGPGDPEAALEEARRAVAASPDAAENQLALAEALDVNGRSADGRAAWERAAALAAAADPAREPEALGWRRQAAAALARGGGP